jgi:hypothetical protein
MNNSFENIFHSTHCLYAGTADPVGVELGN